MKKHKIKTNLVIHKNEIPKKCLAEELDVVFNFILNTTEICLVRDDSTFFFFSN